MPATEQTMYNMKLMHKLFALVGIGMLGATIWMFVADHNRPWKPYQVNTNRVEVKMAEWRQTQYKTEEKLTEKQGLERALDEARAASISPEFVQEFKNEVDADATRRREDPNTVHSAASSEGDVQRIVNRIDRFMVDDAYDPAVLSHVLGPLIDDASFREKDLLQQRKFASANLDAEKGALGILVRDSRPQADQDRSQAKVTAIKEQVDQLTLLYEAAAAHRQKLDEIYGRMTSNADRIAKELDEAEADLNRLADTVRSRRSRYFNYALGVIPVPGKKWLEMPILDAFNSPLKIENLWSDGLTQDYNFSKVRRFDRCTTCHKSIDKTYPGTADRPAYESERLIELSLTVPEGPEPELDTSELGRDDALALRLLKTYGLQLADEGLINRTDVTVEYIQPETVAARALPDHGAAIKPGEQIRVEMLASVKRVLDAATGEDRAMPGLQVGDVIVEINGDPVDDRRRVSFRLLDAITSNGGEPLRLTIRRGLPHPYASHPRLDLFVGSLSPHKLSDFACTICHDGQGSATSFKWASHTPDDMNQRREWMQEYGWFDNHHWIYPMYAKRFAEAACIKCHHEVADLRPSERFPDPPAPNVVHGFDLIRKHGCYGCHEINGYEGPDERVGPDMRLEPNYFAAAQAIHADPGFGGLTTEQQDWVQQLIDHPERTSVRHDLLELVATDAKSDAPKLSKDVHTRIAPILNDIETPGSLRRPGPALRFLKTKVDRQFTTDWIKNPRHFRPSTRMPNFMGMWDHLDEPSRDKSKKYETIEVLGMAYYLEQVSQQMDYIEQPESESPELTADVAGKLYAGELDESLQAMVDRGKQAFMERGCIACHQHSEFTDADKLRTPGEIIQGPDLSSVGTKFEPQRNPNGFKWLYSWIREPTRYHARTVMPDLYLLAKEVRDDKGAFVLDDEGNKTYTDPAADIVAYLLASSKAADWKPEADYELTPTLAKQLDELSLLYLKDAFYVATAEDYNKSGIPAADAAQLKGVEVELAVDGNVTEEELTNLKLRYVGRKTIARYGCYGCHDIPGFEDAKPIGTGLADWGRKESSKLAFEHIHQYLHGHGHGHGENGHGGDGHSDEEHADHGEAEYGHNDYGELPDFYNHALESHHRSGFIYQKLREPRSYDYHKTYNKKYTERLRMPHFNFDHGEREAVVTFVLGLVADPPSEQYVYNPGPREKALIEGRQVLEKYNCGSCHILEGEKWRLSFNPEETGIAPQQDATATTFPFQRFTLTQSQIDDSLTRDSRGRRRAELTIAPRLNAEDGKPSILDYDFADVEAGESYDPSTLTFQVDLWRKAIIDGQPFVMGKSPLEIQASEIERSFPSHGGFLTKYLLPHATKRAVAGSGNAAWTFVPPNLLGQGNKTNPDWLHRFLLSPHPIRPSSLLRMPRFNMSPEEATKLVHYFAARDRSDFPFEFTNEQQPDLLAAKDAAYGAKLDAANPPAGRRLHDAMNIVLDSKVYCSQCHQLGDYMPSGDPLGGQLGPDLTNVQRRLRPDYVRNWIANPNSILPYTKMPVNIQFNANDPDKERLGTKVLPSMYHGNSIEQLDALVDLLTNFDAYLEQQKSFGELVKEANPPAAEGGDGAPADTPPGTATSTDADRGTSDNDTSGRDAGASGDASPASDAGEADAKADETDQQE